MDAETEEQFSVLEVEESSSAESTKKPMRSYTREFLLSLSELEVCKKLPCLPEGFDESLLSEFHDTSIYVPQERPRVPGGSSVQGFRRTDYGSSPPARGDSSSYSRGIQRWDSRSSGKSEGDSDPESGRRFASQARKTWYNTEHDGLLGSGSSARPPGFAAAGAVPRFRPNENLQLNKSNEPYQPPRPYKAGPHTWKETKDSFNDETFGSSDGTSEDRAEEEMKRRAEFELMRKEQHKAFQENQKFNSGKPKDSFTEMAENQENPRGSRISNDLDKVLEEAPHVASKFSVSSQALATRPLVPPGFVSGVVCKSSESKSHLLNDILQGEDLEGEQGLQNSRSITQEIDPSDWFGDMSNSSNFKAKKVSSSILFGVEQARASTLPGVTEVLENSQGLGLNSEISEHQVVGEPVRSTSLLNELFGNGLTTGCESTFNNVEAADPKTEDIWSPDRLQSKFASFFNDEEKKTPPNASPEKRNSLLSLIIGGEKAESDGLNGLATASTILPGEIMPAQKISKLGSTCEAPKISVLTCEDLEQSMLSEISRDISPSPYPAKEQDNFEVMNHGIPGTVVDNSASQRLLSLLQLGVGSDNAGSISGSVEKLAGEDHKLAESGLPESSTYISSVSELNQSDKTLTLEALFGTAFMKELHSAQRNPAASAKIDVFDGGYFSPKMAEIGDVVGRRDRNIMPSNDGITKSGEFADWLDVQDSKKDVELSRLPSEVDAKFDAYDGGIGVRLPEEDSLINLMDPINAHNSVWMPNSSSLGSNTSVNVMEKLAALGGSIKDERSTIGGIDPLLLHNAYDMRKPDISYQNLHQNTSFPPLHRPPMNQSRTAFHPLDHFDPHMKFTPPEAGIQFPTNMGHPSFQQSNMGPPSFDHHISPALQQMHMAGNHPPHLARGFPGEAPMPPHPSHSPAGFIQEQNPTQGFPFGQRYPNFGGSRMMPPGHELGVGNNTPEANQRLLEIESRANPNQMHLFASGVPSRAMHGHELDMGYRYR